MWMNTRERYGIITRLLHWLIFILVVGMLGGGLLAAALPAGSIQRFVITVHKSFGVLVLLLMIVRLAWRAVNPQPRDLDDHAVSNYLAHVLHVGLYTMLFIQPLSGILMSQAYGYPVSFFGLFRLPPLIWQSPALGGVLFEVHEVTAGLLAVAVALHAAAALKHHFVDGDRTLLRMIHGR